MRAEDAPLLHISSAISGDELTLDDGRSLRLEGIKAPDDKTPELADKARKALQNTVKDKNITLENSATDRYGRVVAQAHATGPDDKKIWLQGEMLKQGMAFVFPPTGNENHLSDMLKAESDARKASRGIWADAHYADIPAERVWDAIGSFGFVSGKVLKAARVKNKFYLNFGEDWRKDFTVSIAARDLKKFRDAGIDPAAYEGKIIRVRGWIIREGGPMIAVSNPGQIETTSDKN